MEFISHRGAGHLAEENTVQSVKLASSFAPYYIEIDVHISADSIPHVLHGKVHKSVYGKPLSKMASQLEADGSPSLDSFLKLCKGITTPLLLDIKVKDPDSLDRIMDVLWEHQNQPIGLISMHLDALLYIRSRLRRHVPSYLVQQYYQEQFELLHKARQHQLNGVAINLWWVSPLTYLVAKLYGLELLCYPVSSKLHHRLFRTLYPKLIPITNRPDYAATRTSRV